MWRLSGNSWSLRLLVLKRPVQTCNRDSYTSYKTVSFGEFFQLLVFLLFEGSSDRDCVLFPCATLETWYVLKEYRPKIMIFGLTRKKILFGFILTRLQATGVILESKRMLVKSVRAYQTRGCFGGWGVCKKQGIVQLFTIIVNAAIKWARYLQVVYCGSVSFLLHFL